MLRWLTFCSAHDGHRATQEQPKNRPKRPKNGPKLAIFGCASEQRAADSERSERHHRPCYTKAPSSPVPPGGFQGAEMADILLRSRWSPRNAKTGQKLAKTGQNWPFLAARASGERRTASEARSSTVHAIRKPNLAKNSPKGGKNGAKGAKTGQNLAIFGRAAESQRAKCGGRAAPALCCYLNAPSRPVLLSEGPIKHAKRAKQAKTRRSVVERSMQTGQEQPWLGSLYCLNPNPTVYR